MNRSLSSDRIASKGWTFIDRNEIVLPRTVVKLFDSDAFSIEVKLEDLKENGHGPENRSIED